MREIEQRTSPETAVARRLGTTGGLPEPEAAPPFAPRLATQPPDAAAPPGAPTAWYVIVDELVEGGATLEAWPWPSLSPDSGHLAFDLDAVRRWTMPRADLHALVSSHRDGPAAGRAIRIGDTFRVVAADIAATDQWRRLDDVTAWARSKAKAALYAMAAPEPDPDQVERIRSIERTGDADQAAGFDAGTARPAL